MEGEHIEDTFMLKIEAKILGFGDRPIRIFQDFSFLLSHPMDSDLSRDDSTAHHECVSQNSHHRREPLHRFFTLKSNRLSLKARSSDGGDLLRNAGCRQRR